MNRLAKYTLEKCGGDTKFAAKVLLNSASLAEEEGDYESFAVETEAAQQLINTNTQA